MHLAHSTNSLGEAHLLPQHLCDVAKTARSFASKFSGGELAYWAGLWHDLGKFCDEFQRYIASPGPARGPDHSSAGAVLASRSNTTFPLAYLVAGHHGGLPSYQDLKDRIPAKESALNIALKEAKKAGFSPEPPSLLPWPSFIQEGAPPEELSRKQELFLRMLFSAVVDADFLDTERHLNPGRSQARAQGPWPSLQELGRRFEQNQGEISGRYDDPVSKVRHQVYLACREAAAEPPGLFRLIAPTGAGKTRSSMAFALGHAIAHSMERVIVAIPYTSIIEQNARVYREILGNDAVLEHHSAVGWWEGREDSSTTPSPAQVTLRLASENWDAPIVVTTTVQLFESLFSSQPGRCRKLHNIPRSVVILDEVQMLPVGLLGPILDVLGDLSSHYGVTVVLCSATPPDFQKSVYLSQLKGIREIIANPRPLFDALRRVNYAVQLGDPWGWERVAQEMRQSPQGMAVVNTRNDALALLKALEDPDALHLSTLLCGAHRLQVLEEVRRRLKEGQQCRLVATQVVEAGVDLDFPLVLRSVGPLDRIVQSAGRCNREGRLPRGRVVVFYPTEGSVPPGEYRTGTEIADSLLKSNLDLDAPQVHQSYFAKLASMVDQDRKDIQKLREETNFPEVAHKFRMIEDDALPAIVPYPSTDAVAPFIWELRQPGADLRVLLRRLQPYLVSLRRSRKDTLESQGLIVEAAPGIWEWLGDYDRVVGIGKGMADPERLVI